MAMKLKLESSDIALGFEKKKPFQAAALAAFEDASKLLQAKGRDNIRSAGFSSHFQSGWTTKVFPNDGDPAVYGHHKRSFANVFERGAVVRGKPLLWLPLPKTPKFIGGKRTTASLWARVVGPLRSVRIHSGGKPLLVGKLPGGQESVPLFVGVRAAKIGKRLDITRVGEAVADAIPALFEKHLKE